MKKKIWDEFVHYFSFPARFDEKESSAPVRRDWRDWIGFGFYLYFWILLQFQNTRWFVNQEIKMYRFGIMAFKSVLVEWSSYLFVFVSKSKSFITEKLAILFNTKKYENFSRWSDSHEFNSILIELGSQNWCVCIVDSRWRMNQFLSLFSL